MPAKGQKMPEETKRKIALAQTGRILSVATKAKISAAQKGRPKMVSALKSVKRQTAAITRKWNAALNPKK